MVFWFESSVNSEGIETSANTAISGLQFESSVNSEGIETTVPPSAGASQFESSVNSEGIETTNKIQRYATSLRAV